MLTELKESMIKEVKEGMMTMLNQMKIINIQKLLLKEPDGNSKVGKFNI